MGSVVVYILFIVLLTYSCVGSFIAAIKAFKTTRVKIKKNFFVSGIWAQFIGIFFVIFSIFTGFIAFSLFKNMFL